MHIIIQEKHIEETGVENLISDEPKQRQRDIDQRRASRTRIFSYLDFEKLE